jgi:hypothetical protein
MRPLILLGLVILISLSSTTVAAPRPSTTAAYTTYLPTIRSPKISTHHVYVTGSNGTTTANGTYRVIGEVVNTLPHHVYGVTVSGTFYGHDGMGTASQIGTVEANAALPQTDAGKTNSFQLDFTPPTNVSSYVLDVAYETETPVEYIWVATMIKDYKQTPGTDEWTFWLRVENHHQTQAITDIHLVVNLQHMAVVQLVDTPDLTGVTVPPRSTYTFTYQYTGQWNAIGTSTQAVVVP